MFRHTESLREMTNAWADRAHGFLAALNTASLPAHQVIIKFREAGAVTRHSAQRFHPSSSIEQDAFERLLRIGVIRQPSYAHYYLDEPALAAVQREHRLPE